MLDMIGDHHTHTQSHQNVCDLPLQSIISFPHTCHPDLASVGLDVKLLPAKFACPAHQKIVCKTLCCDHLSFAILAAAAQQPCIGHKVQAVPLRKLLP